VRVHRYGTRTRNSRGTSATVEQRDEAGDGAGDGEGDSVWSPANDDDVVLLLRVRRGAVRAAARLHRARRHARRRRAPRLTERRYTRCLPPTTAAAAAAISNARCGCGGITGARRCRPPRRHPFGARRDARGDGGAASHRASHRGRRAVGLLECVLRLRQRPLATRRTAFVQPQRHSACIGCRRVQLWGPVGGMRLRVRAGMRSEGSR